MTTPNVSYPTTVGTNVETPGFFQRLLGKNKNESDALPTTGAPQGGTDGGNATPAPQPEPAQQQPTLTDPSGRPYGSDELPVRGSRSGGNG